MLCIKKPLTCSWVAPLEQIIAPFECCDVTFWARREAG